MTEDRLQSFAEPWWIACDLHPLKRGQLVKAFVPHVDLVPYTLRAEGRTDPREHGRALCTIEPLRIHSQKSLSTLPVAALPIMQGETWTVHRSKIRPSLVISVGGAEVPKALRPSSSPKWQSSPTIIVAPYYGAESSEKRAGWYGPFLERIKSCEYPQFMLDRLPGAAFDSVLRLDHVQPIGRHQDSYEPLPHRLSEDALMLIDEWMIWLQTGALSDSTSLHDVRNYLMTEAASETPSAR